MIITPANSGVKPVRPLKSRLQGYLVSGALLSFVALLWWCFAGSRFIPSDLCVGLALALALAAGAWSLKRNLASRQALYSRPGRLSTLPPLKARLESVFFYSLLPMGLVWLLATTLPEIVTVIIGRPSILVVHIIGWDSGSGRGRQQLTISESPFLVPHNYLTIYSQAETAVAHKGAALRLVGKTSVFGMAVRDVYLPDGQNMRRDIVLRPPTLPPRTGGTGTIN